MSLMINVLPFLFSISGIFVGYGLALISPEELDGGKKYFILTKQFLFLANFALISFNLLNYQVLGLSLLVVFIAMVLFVLLIRKDDFWLEVPIYSLFVIPYFFFSNLTLKLLLVSLIFLYGFPLGSLIKMKR